MRQPTSVRPPLAHLWRWRATVAAFAIVLPSFSSSGLRFAQAKKAGWQSAVIDVDTAPPGKGPGRDESSVSGPLAEGQEKKHTPDGVVSDSELQALGEAKSSKAQVPLTDDGTQDTVDPRQGPADQPRFWRVEDLENRFCKNCEGVINYEVLLVEKGRTLWMQLLMLVLSIVLFWLLATTAQDFFLPALLYISRKLRLPAEVAGATLMALGNGAPDIATVVTAATKDDLPLALSEMLGSNMFTLCITGGVVVSFMWHEVGIADDDRREKTRRQRLIGVYCIFVFALFAVTMNMMQEHPTVSRAVCLPSIYVLFVIIVVMLPSAASEETEALEAEGIDGGLPSLPPHGSNKEDGLVGVTFPHGAPLLKMIWWAVQAPAYALRWMCIPPVDERWDTGRRCLACFSPLGAFAFCMATNVAYVRQLNPIAWLGFLILVGLLSTYLYLTSNSSERPWWYFPVVPCIALVSSVVWLAVLAGEITAIAEAVGFTMGVPRLRLGFTAIAWGNSLGDFLVCVATVRKGQVSMAISAVFAGPLVDDLLAFGIALTATTWKEGNQTVMCGETCPAKLKGPLMSSIFFITLAASVLTLLLYFQKSLRKHRFCTAYMPACLLFGCYVLFLVVIVGLQRVDAAVPRPHAADRKSVV